MSNKNNDQQALSERAMEKKRDQGKGTALGRPSPGKTAGKGMHPVERDKPIEPDEKTQD